jgi:hypothetical protein
MAINKFTEIMEIKRRSVFAHWSLLVMAVLIFLGAIERPANRRSMDGFLFANRDS